MATIVRIGLGRSKSGKILDRNTEWFSVNTIEEWSRCVNEWSKKKFAGKPLFVSHNGRAYQEINGEKLLRLRDKLLK